MNGMRPKLCYVVSSPMTVSAFLSEHIKVCSKDYDVFVIANFEEGEFLTEPPLNATFLTIAIHRKINLLRDLAAVINLIYIFNKFQFDIIHSVTPKAGLLSQFAGWLVRVPVRIHIFTGQVWVTKKNPKRFLLKALDCLISAFATNILVDSESQRDFLLAERVISANKSHVLNKGSISGVNTQRFHPDMEARRSIRQSMSIPEHDFVLLFLGRLNTDKGVLDLAAAYEQVAIRYPNSWLLLVGPDEEGLESRIRQLCHKVSNRILGVGYTRSPESYFNAADIFCLPSYREGFGTSVIEAAACGLPSVASRIYGITDAVIEGKTGLLHAPGDIAELINCLERLISDQGLYKLMADAAYERVITDFDQVVLSKCLFDYYQRLLVLKNETPL